MNKVRNQTESGSEGLATPDTAQSGIWKGDFGREYTDRNTFDTAALDQLYRKNYGVTRQQINGTFLSDITKGASFLEVGCNTGNQLLLLQQMGYENLSGVELLPYALEIAHRRLPGVELKLGSALSLPYTDSQFDVVFTSGVLIHISPEDVPRAMGEIYRCSRTYIWGMEYYSSETTEVKYRGHEGLLWKMDYARLYVERFPDLELLKEQRLPYVENANVDTVFLLKKQR